MRTPFAGLLAAVISLSGIGIAPAAASAEDPAASAAAQCGSTVTPAPPRAREINLVIDDSGSMFADDSKKPLDRWSQAKYSLEVFAAMLDEADTLRVYRMSDFAEGDDSGPAVTLTGSEPTSARVGKIHRMNLQGGGTPYAPVRKAYRDLVRGEAPNKWLVILSDGEFEGRTARQVEADLRRFAADNTTETTSLRVGFLAIGVEAPRLTDAPGDGVYVERARQSSDLLKKMTGFSNLIFERNILPQTQARIDVDIPLSELMVFAQGPKAAVDALTIDGSTLSPKSTVGVAWADNPRASYGSTKVPAKPNTSLTGTLATFADVPAGSGSVEITGAVEVEMYYKPDVNFGVQLQNLDGEPVDPTRIVGGDYTLYYGFMDSDCSFIESPLLGEVEYSARVRQNGEVIADAFQSGDTISLARGDVQLDVRARYLDGSTAESYIDMKVLQPARPTRFDVGSATFDVSQLSEASLDRAIPVDYGIESAGALTPFSAEEWASLRPEDFSVTTESNIEFQVVVTDEIGKLLLVPRAPGGEPLEADTGPVSVVVEVAHTYDEQLYQSSFSTTVDIRDDLSFWDRFVHWFATVGWWIALLVLLGLLILGYIVKPRFSPRMKTAPTVRMRPLRPGQRPGTGQGRFTTRRLRKFVPYVADKGTLWYVSGSAQAQFPPFQLKAKRGGRAEVTNWQAFARQKNVHVQVGGQDIDDRTKRAPAVGPTTTITAVIPRTMRFEMTPNS